MQEAATLIPPEKFPSTRPGIRTGANAVFFDAFDDDGETPAAVAVASQLQEIVPIPAPANTSKLEDEASRHRVLLVRGGAVIAVTTIIAVGGALLIHAVFAGLIILGSLFPWFQGSTTTSGGSGASSVSDAAGGFSMLGTGPDDNAPPSPNPVYTAGRPDAGAATVLPTLTPLPETSSREVTAQMMQAAAPELPASSFGSVRIQPPKDRSPTALGVSATGLEPPQDRSGTVSGAPGTAAGTSGTALGARGTAARGTGTGNGGGNDDEPDFGWVKGSGSGKGRGSGAGNGIDRGMSAADRQPQLLNFASSGNSAFQLPMKYQIKPPEQSVKFTISIAADGSIAAVHLDQSCGVSDVDELAKAYIVGNLRFSPAYKAGKAVTADFPFELSFKPFD